MRHVFWKTLLGALAGASMSTALMAGVESSDPIKITLQDWTGELINAHIMGSILEAAGYNVKYVQADYLAQFAGLETGDLDLAPEIWATTGQEALKAGLATGKVENFGSDGMLAKEEWWYPIYMKKLCPGLPDWHALLSAQCAKAFSTPETAPKGRYLAGPVTWGGFDEQRVAALKLPFVVVHSGTDAALFAELESAEQRKAPIMLWIYSPHWAPSKYKGEWVKFPPYTPACYKDPSWGVNPKLAYDCGKPNGPIWKVGWIGLKDKWPGAYKIIKAYKINVAEMDAMIAEADLKGKPVKDVVKQWMGSNKSRWQSWIGH